MLRYAALALVLITMVALFVSCRSASTSAGLGDVASVSTTAENKSDADLLKKIANMVSHTYVGNAKKAEDNLDTRAMLVAATRGYDMSAKGFLDSEVEIGVENPATEEEKLVIAKRVLVTINEKASDSDKVAATDIEGLNYADVLAIVNALQVTVNVNPGTGFMDKIYGAIGTALSWITNYLGFHSYIIGICIFAIIVEILMIPFAIKQQKNSIKQAKLRPKEMAIRKKYAGRTDQATQQKMQQEIQEFYQRENYSPYSGCLPLIIQLPIIMVLYQIVIKPLQYVLGLSGQIGTALSTYVTTARAAGGLGMTLSQRGSEIELLSALKGVDLSGLSDFRVFSNGAEVLKSYESIQDSIPNFNIGPVNFGLIPSFTLKNYGWVLLLVPVLTFLAYFFSSKLNRKFMPQPITPEGGNNRQVACSNAMTDITMPAMSTVFTFMVPAVVGVYWIFRSLLALLKSFIMSKVMPLPTFTKEDYEQAEKEMKGKKIVVKSENAGRVRSLHHIDDEDYDDTREAALARKVALEQEEAEKEEEPQEKSAPVEAAPLKDESDKAPKENKLKSLFSKKDKSDKNKKQ
ncbi:MAG: membrane protein insertase YidC [Clostridia bacterium]|nr:membrane protein insertase YidC [Clostridia bacterium]